MLYSSYIIQVIRILWMGMMIYKAYDKHNPILLQNNAIPVSIILDSAIVSRGELTIANFPVIHLDDLEIQLNPSQEHSRSLTGRSPVLPDPNSPLSFPWENIQLSLAATPTIMLKRKSYNKLKRKVASDSRRWRGKKSGVDFECRLGWGIVRIDFWRFRGAVG